MTRVTVAEAVVLLTECDPDDVRLFAVGLVMAESEVVLLEVVAVV